MPMESSLSLAMWRSIFAGTEYTWCFRLLAFLTRYSEASAWLAKLMSITEAGGPSGGAGGGRGGGGGGFAEEVKLAAIFHDIFIDEWADRPLRAGEFFERWNID